MRTSWLLVDRHGEHVDFILAGPPGQHGELAEQLVGRADIVLCAAVIEAAARLYRDPSGRPKRGAAGKGPGCVRHFAAVVRQLMRNYDLWEGNAETVLALLPEEFARFRS